ncbi:hypothetical protein B0H12DRAFT_1234037 [Mycena haematopus]|nr:hypothetical protein B0H12DRAFT_1234037 [Mycena haematopus]
MSRPLESLPQPLLDGELDITAASSDALDNGIRDSQYRPSPLPVAAQPISLVARGASARISVRVLFHTISLQDDARVLALESSAAYPNSDALLNETPIDTDLVVRLLGVCTNIEALVWESAFPPPDGLCEVLATHNPRLAKVWDAPSLPLLSGLQGLTSLRLCRLSQAGARAFAALLENLSDESLLESLAIDFVWLDDPLCEKILSDKGIVTILEGCDALEEFVLDEVQGRLSRTLWTKPTCFPATLKTLRVVVAETGPHHSWATDHLDSLHAVPLGSLSVLDVVRREAPPSLQCGVVVYDGIVDDAVA